MLPRRQPVAALRPFVELIWACEGALPPEGPARERVLRVLRRGMPIAATAAACALSHRHFTLRCCDAVGLAPKTWCRIERFGRGLDCPTADPHVAWAELAAAEPRHVPL